MKTTNSNTDSCIAHEPARSPSSKRQSSLLSDHDRRRAQDDRLVDDLRQSITRRVDGQYLPTVLSRETLAGVIEALDESPHIGAVTADLNYEALRHWVADCCELDYNLASEDRYYPFRKRELQAIDYELADAGLEPTAEIETDNPPLARNL